MTIDLASVRRLVVAPPNWLGDAVLALPAMAAVRRAAPQAHLTIAAAPAVSEVFREVTDVAPDAVLDLPGGQAATTAALAAGRFELAVLLPNSFGSAWRYRRAGVPGRWGYAAAGRSLLLTRRVRRPRRRDARHMIDYYRSLVRGLGVEVGDEPPRLAASPESLRAAGRLLSGGAAAGRARLVVVAPGAAYGQAKQWPPDRMAALVARLVARGDTACAVVGAAHDRPAARALESWLRAHAPASLEHVADLVGRTSLGALVGVTARADVFVSNDSGAMHLAAALGRPVVAIFGPTDERATGPIGAHDVISEPVFCRPCLLRDCPIDHRCMKRITVDRIAAAVTARIEAARP
jgi:heptosyltransferase-2